MARNCGPGKGSCGMKLGLFNPFFTGNYENPYSYSTSNRGEAADFSSFTLSEDNPVVLVGDDDNLRNQTHFEIDDETWGMAYLVGDIGDTPGLRLGIKYATAPKSDPHNWTKVDTFLVETDTEDWDTNIDTGQIRKLDDGSWLMIYGDWGSGQVGIATRAAGSFGAFTKHASNPVLDNSANTGDFDQYIRHICWLKEGDTYYLFAEGRKGANDGINVLDRGIVLYTSPDFLNWTRYGDDYLIHASHFPNTFVEFNNLWMPDVQKIGDTYFMVCLAHKDNYTGQLNGNGFVFLKSTDLINWELLNTQRAFMPRIGKAGSWENYSRQEPSLFVESGNVHLYWNGKEDQSGSNPFQIGYATLTGGTFDNNLAPIFTDDFGNDSIDVLKWDTSPQGGITVTETSGALEVAADGSPQSLVEVLAGLTGIGTVNDVVWSMGFKYLRDTVDGGDCQVGLWNADNSNGVYFAKGSTLDKIVLKVMISSVEVYSEEVDYNQNSYLKIQKFGHRISWWESKGQGWNNLTPGSVSTFYYDAVDWPSETVYPKILAANDTDAYTVTIDDIFLYDFNSPLFSAYVTGYNPHNIVLSQSAFKGYTDPSSGKQTKESAFLQALLDAGVLNSALCIKLFKTDGDSDYATLDFSHPTFAARQAEKVNNPTFTSDTGFNSDGSTSYLRSGIGPTDINQDDFTIYVKGFVNAQGANRTLFGAGDDGSFGNTSGGYFCNPRNTSNIFSYRAASSGTAGQQANTDATARIAIAKKWGTEYRSLNGAAFTADNLTDDTVSSGGPFILLATRNSLGTINGYSTGGLQYFLLFGRKLNSTEHSAVDAAIVDYLS